MPDFFKTRLATHHTELLRAAIMHVKSLVEDSAAAEHFVIHMRGNHQELGHRPIQNPLSRCRISSGSARM